jgi:hypothetical protein
LKNSPERFKGGTAIRVYAEQARRECAEKAEAAGVGPGGTNAR